MSDMSLGAYGVQPSLRAYEPTWRDRISAWMLGDSRDPVRQKLVGAIMGSHGLGSTGMGMVDLTPAGIPLAVNESQRSANEGDWTGATLNAMAMIPGARAGQKAIEAGVNEVKQGIRAYHGSPHDFDKFDLGKIGTGEGAQAYGHGLYFAENEGVAREYRKNLTQSRIASAQRSLAKTGGDVDAAIAASKAEIERLKALPNAGGDVERRDSLIRLQEEKLGEFNLLKNSGQMSPGRTYEVSINAHPDEFLDWDKPLSEQSPGVRAVLQNQPASNPPVRLDVPVDPAAGAYTDETRSGAELYRLLGDDPAASVKALRAKGIKGIRYKDAGSRGAEGGTHNYVVFDDKIIDILRKYGIAGLTTGGLGALAAGIAPGEARADGLYGLP